MGDVNSANRLPFSRTEGIWVALSGAEWRPHAVRCALCGRILSTSRLVLASHGKRHVREGLAVAVTDCRGDYPRTLYVRAPAP